jgi:hypothetical protein
MPTIRPTDITFGRDDLVAGQLTVTYDAITSIRFEYIIRKHYPQMVTLHHLQFEICQKQPNSHQDRQEPARRLWCFGSAGSNRRQHLRRTLSPNI